MTTQFPGVSKVLGTALIDARFCNQLLNNPAVVLAQMNLSNEEMNILKDIKAFNITEFATAVSAALSRMTIKESASMSSRFSPLLAGSPVHRFVD